MSRCNTNTRLAHTCASSIASSSQAMQLGHGVAGRAPGLTPQRHRVHRQTVSSKAVTTSSNIRFPVTLPDQGRSTDASQLVDMLAPFLMDGRVERIQKVVSQRTYNVLPIVEDIYDMGNLAAVCRSADAMGFGAVHCISTSKHSYKQSQRTSAGADKWLEVKVWNNSTTEALTAVKEAGYQLVVTHLSKSSVTIQEVDWTRPTAFVLGNETRGVSEEAVALADHCAIIPMAGFVESFNISVAAALIMYEAQQQRIRKLGKNGDLTDEQQHILQAALMARSVRQGPTLIEELLNRPPPAWQISKLKKKL